jgi:hypothetical protein
VLDTTGDSGALAQQVSSRALKGEGSWRPGIAGFFVRHAGRQARALVRDQLVRTHSTAQTMDRAPSEPPPVSRRTRRARAETGQRHRIRPA